MNNQTVVIGENTKTFRERLKMLMKEHNEDKKTLSKQIKISETTIGKWLNGYPVGEVGKEVQNYQRIKPENIEKLCEHYSVSPEYLFGIEEYSNHTKQEIGDLIGLSENAIDTLIKWADPENPFIEALFVLDTILTADKRDGFILNMYQYFVSDNSFPIVTHFEDIDGEKWASQEPYDNSKLQIDYILPCETEKYITNQQTPAFKLDGSLLRTDAITKLTACLESIRKEKVSPDPVPPKRRGRPPKQKGDDRL